MALTNLQEAGAAPAPAGDRRGSREIAISGKTGHRLIKPTSWKFSNFLNYFNAVWRARAIFASVNAEEASSIPAGPEPACLRHDAPLAPAPERNARTGFVGQMARWSRDAPIMRRYQQRHAANGRASASLSITDTGRAEVRVSIGLGAGRFMTVGLSLAQVEAVADAISQVHDDIVEHYGAVNDRPPCRAA